MLLNVYTKHIDGQDEAARQRIEAALNDRNGNDRNGKELIER